VSGRLAATPAQLRAFLEVLGPFGFSAAKVELSPDGGIILHSQNQIEEEQDRLAEWEASRARQTH
jgi:hypothetical protein